MSDPVRQSGLLTSLRQLLLTALEMARVRLELLGTEVEFEKRRLFDGLLWGAFALLLLGIGLALLCGFVILLFWDGYRLAAVASMSLLFLLTGLALMREARQRLNAPSCMFKTSLAELEQDKAGLEPAPRPRHE